MGASTFRLPRGPICYAKEKSNTKSLFLKKKLKWKPIIHLKVSEQNPPRKTSKYALSAD